MMIKRIKILILCFLFLWTNALSQQLSQQVLVSVAGVTSTGAVNYSQTIGETAVEIIGHTGYVFTQGFQQPGIKQIPENLPNGNGVNVYPNPAIDDLTIKLFGDNPRDFRIDIINITGTIVISEKLSFIDKFYYEKVIPVGHLYRGLYFIRITSADKVINRTFKIDKI